MHSCQLAEPSPSDHLEVHSCQVAGPSLSDHSALSDVACLGQVLVSSCLVVRRTWLELAQVFHSLETDSVADHTSPASVEAQHYLVCTVASDCPLLVDLVVACSAVAHFVAVGCAAAQLVPCRVGHSAESEAECVGSCPAAHSAVQEVGCAAVPSAFGPAAHHGVDRKVRDMVPLAVHVARRSAGTSCWQDQIGLRPSVHQVACCSLQLASWL